MSKKAIINQKIGKLEHIYPTIARHYDIKLLVDEKTKKVTSINWKAKESQENQEKGQGVDFKKIRLKEKDEQKISKTYNAKSKTLRNLFSLKL